MWQQPFPGLLLDTLELSFCFDRPSLMVSFARNSSAPLKMFVFFSSLVFVVSFFVFLYFYFVANALAVVTFQTLHYCFMMHDGSTTQ